MFLLWKSLYRTERRTWHRSLWCRRLNFMKQNGGGVCCGCVYTVFVNIIYILMYVCLKHGTCLILEGWCLAFDDLGPAIMQQKERAMPRLKKRCSRGDHWGREMVKLSLWSHQVWLERACDSKLEPDLQCYNKALAECKGMISWYVVRF